MWPLLTQSYWRDEAFSVLLASRPVKEIFALVIRFDHTPPFFYYLQHGWIGVFGDGEIAVRSLSLLFHLWLIYFVYRLSKSRLVALAVGLNPFLWQYALEARHYSAFGALVMGGIYFFQAGKFSRANLFWGLALLTHNFAWLYFLVFTLLNRTKKLLPALLLGSLWLPFAWQQISRLNQGTWLGSPTGPWWWNSWQAFWVTPLLTWTGLTLMFKPRRRLLILALAPPLIAYVISRFWTPIYLERYLLPTLPLLIIAGLPRLKKWGVVLGLASVIGLLSLYQQTTKAPIRQAVETIAGQIQPEEIIITEQPINYLEVYYYLKPSGNQDRLYSYLYPGEEEIPYYVGTDLIKPWQEIVTVPAGRPYWLVKPDGSVIKYE